MKLKYGERIKFQPYLLIMILILATFTYSNFLIVRSIRAHYYRILETQSLQYAQSYAHSISKAAQASEVINELLEDKLISACKTMALFDDWMNETALAQLAASLGLDEIFYYSPQGEIISSNTGHYLGWTAFFGHPVYDFMASDLEVLVEEIRPDTESGELNKYAYIKLDTGFVQLGIKAQRVEFLLYAFQSEQLLKEIGASSPVDSICFLNSGFVIQESSNPELIGLEITEPQIRSALQAGATYSAVGTLQGRDVYKAYIPIQVGDEKVGSLAVAQSLAETKKIIAQTTSLGTIALVIVFTALAYALYLAYNKKKRLLTMAYFHNLTGLPNRRYLETVLKNGSGDATEKKALLLFHYQNFGEVNHLYGFHYGDRMLRQTALKLRENFQKYYELFHFSAERFALYVKNYETREGLGLLATEIIGHLEALIASRGLKQRVTTKVGIVEIEEAYDDPNEIFTQASLALMHTEESTQPYSFFSPEMKTRLLREDLIERELRFFLSQPQSSSQLLHLEYQPIVDLQTNQIKAFEALARMHSPHLGFVFPLEFIGIAERKQLIIPLGAWVMERACRFLKNLETKGYNEIAVSVNVSGIELFESRFPDKIKKSIEKCGVNPANLELEITESIMLYNFREINSIFQQLKDIGIKIALDDFGTGYSSLSRLQELNVDILKIDKHFIDKIPVKDQGRLVFGDLIAMSHKLGLTVVAEGVETKEQQHYLKTHHCDLMQGYLFSRPLKEKKAIQMLKENNASA